MSADRALLRAKLREARHGLEHALGESKFKTVFLSLAYPCVAAVAFGISYAGLRQLASFPVIGTLLAERVVALMFFGASVMLVLSTVIIGLGLLYRSQESEYLLGLPIPAHTAYRVRAIESVTLSSWAFVLLGLPFAGAMAVAFDYGGRYVIAFAILGATLAWLSGNAGLLLVLAFGRWLVRGKAWLSVVAVMAVVTVVLVLGRRPDAVMPGPTALAILRMLLARTGWTRSGLFPSHWASASLEAFLSGQLLDSIRWFAPLALGSFALWRVNLHVSHVVYPSVWSVAQSTASRRRKPTTLSGALKLMLGMLRPRGRALLRKDLLLWGRNPVFWGQTAIFFGLLALYFLNLRTLRYDELSMLWRSVAAILNVSAVSLVTGALTTRFLYPSISTEGPRFWVLGLAPLPRSSILKHKLVLGLVWFSPIAIGLGALSSVMLRLPRFHLFWSVALLVLVTPTLSCLAAGLGAAFPSRRQESTEKAVSGFGGTLTLALSLFYLLSVMVLGSRALHLKMTGTPGWGACLLGALALSLLGGVGAMIAGVRRLERMEF
jgi:ABC-2 type transport system permease protein